MLVTVDFTPDEETHLAQLMEASKEPNIGVVIKAAVAAYQPPVADPITTAPEPAAAPDQPGHDGA